MPLSWSRPANVEFPKVWQEFEANDLDGSIIKYRVQDLPEDRFHEAIYFMQRYHMESEVLRVKRIRNDPVSFREITEKWWDCLRQKVTLVCFKENSNEIVGLNVLGIVTQDEANTPHHYKGKGWSEIVNSKKYLTDHYFDAFKHFQVDKLMFALGLIVLPEYRRRGIAYQLMRAREEIGKAIGIRVSSNVFTSLGAQRAAEKAGYEDYFSIKFSDLEKLNEDSKMPGIEEKYLKIMSKKFY
jgi:GNAT superfamily N-acetyltransferase